MISLRSTQTRLRGEFRRCGTWVGGYGTVSRGRSLLYTYAYKTKHAHYQNKTAKVFADLAPGSGGMTLSAGEGVSVIPAHKVESRHHTYVHSETVWGEYGIL